MKDLIGIRAQEVATKLAAASDRLERDRPEFVQVGEWRLLALADNDNTRQAADSIRRDVKTCQPGRGFDFWHARPGLIKFTASGPLAAAYRATGDQSYAKAFRFLLEDYLLSLEPPRWAGGGMRLSQRIGRWAQFLPYFFDAKIFDEAFVQRIVDAIPEQLASILRAHKRHARGNIRLLETDGLFQVGLRLPMLEGTGEALERARWVWADTARRAVFEDGSYCEYDPNYHEVFQATFYNVLLWREAFPELALPDVRATAARVFEYAAVTRSPIGHACGIQESPSPWIADGDCAQILRRRREVRRLAGLPETPPPLVHACLNASQVFLRTGWEREAMFAAFDASRWGGAHSHLARNGLLLYAFGRALLADTGSLTYAMGHKGHEGDEFDHRIGPYGKSTRAHNTLNLNGWNQAPTNPDSLTVFTGEGVTAVSSVYSGGYWPGSYGWWFSEGFGAGIHAVHERIMIWLPSRCLVVVDLMTRWDESVHGHEAQQTPSLEMNWQLSPGGEVRLADDGRGFTSRYPEGGLLGRFARLPDGMALSVHEGETDPPRGWATTRTKARHALRRAGVFDDPAMAPYRDRTYVPSPQLAGVVSPMQHFGEGVVSVFVPFPGHQAPIPKTHLEGEIAATSPQQSGGRLTIEWPAGTVDLLTWSHRLKQPLIEAAFAVGKVKTDGCLAHVELDADGGCTGGGALDASYAEWDGQQLDIASGYAGY